MPETPGHANLPGVNAEADEIHRAVQAQWPVELLHRPSKQDVLERLGSFTIAHFACHGSSDQNNPSESYLALKGASESEPERLSVQDMLSLSIGQAWLVYFSACSTAKNEFSLLMDENLHLASAFQAAGFGQVIASRGRAKVLFARKWQGYFTVD